MRMYESLFENLIEHIVQFIKGSEDLVLLVPRRLENEKKKKIYRMDQNKTTSPPPPNLAASPSFFATRISPAPLEGPPCIIFLKFL